MKKKWETGRLDSKSLYIVTPKEIEVCMSVPAEIDGFPVKTIKDQAFRRENDTVLIETIVIPFGVETIGKKAFANQYKLTSVYLPASVISIAKNAFYDEEDGLLSRVTIHAPAGSYAEQYAKENNIPFVAE